MSVTSEVLGQDSSAGFLAPLGPLVVRPEGLNKSLSDSQSSFRYANTFNQALVLNPGPEPLSPFTGLLPLFEFYCPVFSFRGCLTSPLCSGTAFQKHPHVRSDRQQETSPLTEPFCH